MQGKEITLDWTPFALSCLNEIHDHITYKEKGSDQANKLVDKIFDRVEQLKSFPESGQKEPLLIEIGQESRYLVEASYKIIYEYHPVHSLVIITDVFQTSQYPVKIKRSLK